MVLLKNIIFSLIDVYNRSKFDFQIIKYLDKKIERSTISTYFKSIFRNNSIVHRNTKFVRLRELNISTTNKMTINFYTHIMDSQNDFKVVFICFGLKFKSKVTLNLKLIFVINLHCYNNKYSGLYRKAACKTNYKVRPRSHNWLYFSYFVIEEMTKFSEAPCYFIAIYDEKSSIHNYIF